MDKNITLSPVFIEPSFKHSFLKSSNKYFYILIFEIIVTLIIINFFFKEEILNAFIPVPVPKNAITNLLNKTTLSCEENGTMMIHRESGKYPALNLDGSPIIIDDCSLVLSSLNGRSTSPYAIFNR
ncbi:putative membrane protein [Turkeypox virus]|uniref:Membrane protein n=1 Tax=Turkeypox virus TaxID=336486 RepID=A0A0M3ZK27_9POXV|nr:hypothetical protein ASN15_gp095 [Turkeypox virus]ALA62469.2 putative membrane protein [Turkeypox virus]